MALNWQEAPKISDKTAFPTLKQHASPKSQSQQSNNVPSQLQQPVMERKPNAKPTRTAPKVRSMSWGQVSSPSKKPIHGSWGQRPKIGAKTGVASRRGSRARKLNVRTTGSGAG